MQLCWTRQQWETETTQFMPLKRCSLLETNKHAWNWGPNRSMLSETKLQSVGIKVDESRHVSSQILRQHRRKGEDVLPKCLHQQRWTPLPVHYKALLIIFPHYFPTWSHHLPNMQMTGLFQRSNDCQTSNDRSQAFWFQSLRIVRPTHPWLPRTFMILFYFNLCILLVNSCCFTLLC